LAAVADVTCDSDTTFKVKRSRSTGRFTQRGLNAWGRCSGDCENVLGVGNYCYVASARRWGAHGKRRGAGHIVSPRAQLVTNSYTTLAKIQWQEVHWSISETTKQLLSISKFIEVAVL